MYGDINTLKNQWKEIESLHVSEDTKATGKPCFLYSASLVATTGGAATAVLRDGHDTNAEAKLYLAALTSSYDQRKFDPPLYFKKGLFIDVGSYVTSVHVEFLVDKD